jgi:peptidoglycan-N-acetylglucosamine deacetylase
MRPAFSALLRATALSGAILLTGCLEGPSQAQCGPDALGVSRTLLLTAESPPPYDLLEPGEVILTFDDGPATFRTKRVMKALGQECTRATFFLLGNEAEVRPGLAKDIREAGHTVGSHSLDHANLTELSLAAAVENAEAGKAAVEAAIGQPTPLFRFPYVATNPELSQAIRAAGMIDVTVTADGADWTHNTPEEAVEMILAKLEQHDRRGMILLHDPQANSAARTRLLLQALKEQGYQVVALEQPEG